MYARRCECCMHVGVQIFVCVYVCVYARMCVCTCTGICVYMHECMQVSERARCCMCVSAYGCFCFVFVTLQSYTQHMHYIHVHGLCHVSMHVMCACVYTNLLCCLLRLLPHTLLLLHQSASSGVDSFADASRAILWPGFLTSNTTR